jgi:thiol-disulfide isomerase/thioredoxin
VRSDRRALAALAAIALAMGCREPASPSQEPVPERFAGVRRKEAPPAAHGAFCERSYPPGGTGSRRWVAPPERPLPGPDARASAAAAGVNAWTWVNLWATWCTPCVEEMELLGRWRDGFSRDGTPVRLELVSVDAAEREKELVERRSRGLPGHVRWLRSEADLGPLLDALGVERDAMIPVHVLVDASGWIRCVRVGAVHEQDYAAVKAFLAATE